MFEQGLPLKFLFSVLGVLTNLWEPHAHICIL